MNVPIFFVFLLQVLSCVVCFVSRRNVANDEVFKLLGRVNSFRDIYSYHGVRFNIESQNTTANVNVNFNSCAISKCEYFVEVRVDCAAVQKFEVNPISTSFVFELNTVVGQSYEIEFRKLSESSNGDAKGVMVFGDISLEGAEFLPQKEALLNQHPNCIHRHKLLVIGDSVGVDSSAQCSFSADTENEEHSYAALVATSVEAELQVMRSYGDMSRTFYDQPPTPFPADIVLVLVMLGTNNHTYEPNPRHGLTDRLGRISVDYPQAKGRIAALCVPMEPDAQCGDIVGTSTLRLGVGKTMWYKAINPSTLNGGYGCDGHPNAATPQFMADIIMPLVKEMLYEY